MAATSIAAPTMMVFSFLPMPVSFNDKVAKVSKYIFFQQCRKIMEETGVHGAGTESMVIISVNFLLVIVLFIFQKMAWNRII